MRWVNEFLLHLAGRGDEVSGALEDTADEVLVVQLWCTIHQQWAVPILTTTLVEGSGVVDLAKSVCMKCNPDRQPTRDQLKAWTVVVKWLEQ